MDPHRFDRLSKTFASRLSRRNVLGALGAGGLAAAVSGDIETISAAGSTTCVYDFDCTVDVGPSSTLGATSEVGGELTIIIGEDGAINAGSLVRPNGDSWHVVGQATGRAINLRISVPHTGAIIAIGTGRTSISRCTAAMSGPASGPLRRDAGSWIATLKSSGSPAQPTAAATVASSGGASTQPTPTSAPDNSVVAASPPASDASTACDIECGGDTLGVDPGSCTCLCTDGLVSCTYEVGSIPAKGGVIFRPGPITHPVGFCIDTATDLSNCGGCGIICGNNQGVASAACAGGACSVTCQPGYDSCAGAEPCATNLAADVNNCGACGVVCSGSGMVCANGTCACGNDCGPGGQLNSDCSCTCPSNLQSCAGACVDTNTDPDNCGGCGRLCQAFERNCSAGLCHPIASTS